MIKSLLLAGNSIFMGTIAMSNHIAGGDFAVQFIDANYFEAKLQLFRDCEGNAIADNLINISVYDAGTNAYQQSLSFTMSNLATDSVPIGTPCFDLAGQILKSANLDTDVYEWEVDLSSLPNFMYIKVLRDEKSNKVGSKRF